MDVDDSNDSLQDQCLDAVHCDKQLRMASKLLADGHTHNPLISGGNTLLSSTATKAAVNRFSDTVSPSLLTGNDLEIWKEIQLALKENRSLDFLDELDNNPSMFNI